MSRRMIAVLGIALLLVVAVVAALAGRSFGRQMARNPDLVVPLTGLRTNATPPAVVAPVLPAASAPLALAASLRPNSQQALLDHADVPSYRITATFDPDARTIAGAQTVIFTNTATVALNDVVFRMYANRRAPWVQVSFVQVNGSAVQPDAPDETLLRVPLATPLAPGQSVTIDMGFTADIPTGEDVFDGLYGEENGIFTLYGWHPELSELNDGVWLTYDLYLASLGDISSTDVANYQVQIDTPDDLTLVAGGSETVTAYDGGLRYQISSALTRNLVLSASRQFVAIERRAGDVLVTSYALAGHEAANERAADVAAGAIARFDADFGAYPFAELDVVESVLSGGAGMEATGLIMIGDFFYEDPGMASTDGSDGFTFVIAHEAAHQWWYSVVGSSSISTPWMDEGLTNWSAVRYVETAYGPEAGSIVRDTYLNIGYRQRLLSEGDIRLDQPLDRFNGGQYSDIVYGKGALIYDVLRAQLGDASLFRFLKAYYREQAFGQATPAEWRAALAAELGTQATDTFYRTWVEGNAITPEMLPPLGPYGASFFGLSETPTP